ncbi:GGDEF domain-containing protein [Legionella sp. CNM-4043-24]|uniref:GGDEF domain-containing protein n=1 Tax=Legionella sp. CNM-4043-24 TaxID=3421646 RepID=UPI00403B1CB6
MKPLTPQIHDESVTLLFESSLKSIPFNVILAVFMSASMIYNQVAPGLVMAWLSAVAAITLIRWGYSQHVIRRGYDKSKTRSQLGVFLFLTGCTGLIWSICYFIFISQVPGMHEAIIILVLGGMSAGAIASLSVYLPAYYTYLLPMFLPIIAYNFYPLEFERTLMAIMYLLFVIMLMITARINSSLLHKTFELSEEKDRLINELKVTNQKLEHSVEEIKIMSITDSLTGLFNRRYFDSMLKNEISRAKRNSHSLSLILIDVDNFKYINDTFGHPCGDDFLVYVADSLKLSIRRSNDIIFRLGGDEFAAILSNMSPEDSISMCSYIQNQFSRNNQHENVTLSMSVVSILSNYTSAPESIISTADQALYQAKENGKNQIVSRLLLH